MSSLSTLLDTELYDCDTEEEFIKSATDINCIENKRKTKTGEYEYLVHWKNGSSTWESESIEQEFREIKLFPEGMYLIKKLVNMKVIPKTGRFYRVRWEGYGSVFDTWEPEQNIPLLLRQNFVLSQESFSRTSKKKTRREKPKVK